jgi:hypothetical protein
MRQLIIALAFLSLAPTARAENPALTCYEEAFKWMYDQDCSVRLCAGATSTAPVDCAREVFGRLYSKKHAVELCRPYPTSANGSSVECR